MFSINIQEVVKEDGVKDLSLAVKAKFAHALISEREGNNVQAQDYLDQALVFEAKRTA